MGLKSLMNCITKQRKQKIQIVYFIHALLLRDDTRNTQISLKIDLRSITDRYCLNVTILVTEKDKIENTIYTITPNLKKFENTVIPYTIFQRTLNTFILKLFFWWFFILFDKIKCFLLLKKIHIFSLNWCFFAWKLLNCHFSFKRVPCSALYEKNTPSMITK